MLLQVSYGILKPKGKGPQLIKMAAVFIASAQNVLGNLVCMIMLRARSFKVLFILPGTPFCWGVLGIGFTILLPLSVQYCLKSLSIYPPPLSDLQLQVILVLHHGLTFLEGSKHIRFILHEINSYFSCGVVDESHVVARTSERGDMSWLPYIYVHKLKLLSLQLSAPT